MRICYLRYNCLIDSIKNQVCTAVPDLNKSLNCSFLLQGTFDKSLIIFQELIRCHTCPFSKHLNKMTNILKSHLHSNTLDIPVPFRIKQFLCPGNAVIWQIFIGSKLYYPFSDEAEHHGSIGQINWQEIGGRESDKC